MCPNYLASDRQPLCLCHPRGLMCPSEQERAAHCTARFDACTIYLALRREAERAHRLSRHSLGVDRQDGAF